MNTWRAEGHSHFKLNCPFIADLKRHDFVALVAFTEVQVCAPKLIREFTAMCREMVPAFAAHIPGIESTALTTFSTKKPSGLICSDFRLRQS